MVRAWFLVALTLGLVLVLGFFGRTRPLEPPSPPVSDQERTHYDEIKQKVLNKNPDLKAEEAALQDRAQTTEQESRTASEAHSEASRALEDHEQKVRMEAYKIDPSFDGIFFRMKYPQRQEVRDLEEYDSASLLFSVRWHFVREACSVFAAVVCLILLLRPTSYATANLYLVLALTPALFAGPDALSSADWVYFYQLDGLYDGPNLPQSLLIMHRGSVTAYLWNIPALVLYPILLCRAYFQNRESHRS